MTSFFSFSKMHSIKYFSKNDAVFVMQAICASKIFIHLNKEGKRAKGGGLFGELLK